MAIVRTRRATLRQIIAVTFTEKAAGEMKLRLRAALEVARQAHGATVDEMAALALIEGQAGIVSDPGSNVHLSALRRGVPAIAVNGLAVVTPGREDPLGLVANRVVLCLNRLTALRAAEPVAFYSGDWLERFTRYDAAAGQSGSDLERAAAAGIRRVAKDWRLHRPHA